MLKPTVPFISYTTLLYPQEDEKENKFESSSRLEKSNRSRIAEKTKSSSAMLLEEDSNRESRQKDNSIRTLKVNENNSNLNLTANTINQSNIELISMDRSRDQSNRSMISEEVSIDSGKKGLISKSDEKKKKFVVKKKGWDKDYK